MDKHLILRAWIRLIIAYGIAFVLSVAVGMLFTHIDQKNAETLFNLATKRLTYVYPILEWGTSTGLDLGIVLFVWNSLAALAILSFSHTAAWFNPKHRHRFPRALRAIFCTGAKMKLLCYLPGCQQIAAEPLRRLYLWLAVPFYGVILLGFENGLSVSSGAAISGSFSIAIISLLPHGIIEIPTICLAGAVSFAAHLFIKEGKLIHDMEKTFHTIDAYRQRVPIKTITVLVITALFIAAMVEAHFTINLLDALA